MTVSWIRVRIIGIDVGSRFILKSTSRTRAAFKMVWILKVIASNELLCLVSGAGDCLTAGFLAALLRGAHQHAAVASGMQGKANIFQWF
jgi:hypothetical protein